MKYLFAVSFYIEKFCEMNRCKILLPIVIAILFVGCSDNRDKVAQTNSENIAVKRVDDAFLIDTLKQLDEVYVFLSADWCGGGKLTYHNMVAPYLDELEKRRIAFIPVYIGDIARYEFEKTKPNQPLTLYHLDDSWPDIAYFDKKRLSAIIEESDDSFQFQNKTPLCLYLKKGKVVAESPLENLVEKGVF